MRRVIVIVLLCAGVVACDMKGVPLTTSNPAAKVETLFDVDGYRVYRFDDGGHNVYFVLPAHGERQASAAWMESCGKDCTRAVSVPTLLRDQ